MSLWTLHGPVTCELSGPFHSFNFYRPKFSWQMLSALQTVRSGRIGATSIQRGNLCTKIISAPADICVQCVGKKLPCYPKPETQQNDLKHSSSENELGIGRMAGEPEIQERMSKGFCCTVSSRRAVWLPEGFGQICRQTSSFASM